MKRVLSALVLSVSLASCTASVVNTNSSSSGPASADGNAVLTIRGSDTEVQMVSTLAEAFTKEHPDAHISVTGGGSAAGIASLINGEIPMANSSREMSKDEKALASGKGIAVQEFRVSRDGLSIIVHPSNPLKSISMDDLGKLYRGEVKNWKEIGGADLPVSLYGRQSTSGTFGYFRDAVLKADYATEMRGMEGNQAIVDAVKQDKGGIGYVGVGYVKDETGNKRTDIAILSLPSLKDGTEISPLDMPRVLDGEYPLNRVIYQYIAGVPKKNSVLDQFLRFEVSDEGQAIVEKAGFYKLTTADQEKNTSFFSAVQ